MGRALYRTLVAVALGVAIASCGDSSREDAAAPEFAGVTVENPEANRAVVVWNTSVPTDGELAIGTSRESLDRKIQARAMTPSHRTSIGGLDPATTYYFRVRARSTDGLEAESEVLEFTTRSDRPQMAAPGDTYDVAVVTTKFGEIVIRFLEDQAPGHVENFKKLARQGFYNGTTFHRVVPGFMIQGGDPNSKDANRRNDGQGGPGYTIPAEIGAPHPRGAVAAARTGGPSNPQKRSSGSQFYICVAPTPFLDGDYTVYGHVVRGMDVADKIVAVPRETPSNNPFEKVEMRVEMRTLQADQAP